MAASLGDEVIDGFLENRIDLLNDVGFFVGSVGQQ